MKTVLILAAAIGVQATSDEEGKCHQDNCYHAIKQHLDFCREWIQPSYGQPPPIPAQAKDGCCKGDDEARISSVCSCLAAQTSDEPHTCTADGYSPSSCEFMITQPCGGYVCEESETTAIPPETECVEEGYGPPTCPPETTETCDGYGCEEPSPMPTPSGTIPYGGGYPCVSCETEPSPTPTNCYEKECQSEHVPSPAPTECDGDGCSCGGYSCEPTSLTTETTDLCYGDKCTTLQISATKPEQPTFPTSESYGSKSSTTSTFTKVQSTAKTEATTSTQESKVSRPTDTTKQSTVTGSTTSTIYNTTCITTTTCDQECPHGSSITSITEPIPVSTTVCPITETEKPLPPPEIQKSGHSQQLEQSKGPEQTKQPKVTQITTLPNKPAQPGKPKAPPTETLPLVGTQKPLPQSKETIRAPIPPMTESGQLHQPEQPERTELTEQTQLPGKPDQPEKAEQPPAETLPETLPQALTPTALEVILTAGEDPLRVTGRCGALTIIAGVVYLLL